MADFAEPWPLDYQITFARMIRDRLLATRDGAQRDALQGALARLQTGRFGWCERCARSLPYWRVAADPAVRRCKACEESCSRREAPACSAL